MPQRSSPFSETFTLIAGIAMSLVNIPAPTRSRIAQRWLGEVPVMVVGLIMMALCITLLASRGVPISLEGIWVNARLFALFVIVFACLDTAREMATKRPQSLIAHLRARYFGARARAIFAAGAPMLAVAVVLLPFFSMMKAAIPLFNEYSWDATFIRWDRAIFFGRDAWEVLQPMLGYPLVTALLALLYQLWFLLLYPGVLFFAFCPVDPDVRRRFFLSYILSWTVIGGAMATWLASVGPCFVGPMLGNPTFDPQMAYLKAANEQIPIMVLPVQEMLLEWYAEAEHGLGSGITAMPSMHCAIAFLYWIAVRRISRGWGTFFAVFFFITWISSVHLAYHYAVDGLVSLLAVAALWWLSGRVIEGWDRFASALRPAAQPALRTNTAPAE